MEKRDQRNEIIDQYQITQWQRELSSHASVAAAQHGTSAGAWGSAGDCRRVCTARQSPQQPVARQCRAVSMEQSKVTAKRKGHWHLKDGMPFFRHILWEAVEDFGSLKTTLWLKSHPYKKTLLSEWVWHHYAVSFLIHRDVISKP